MIKILFIILVIGIILFLFKSKDIFNSNKNVLTYAKPLGVSELHNNSSKQEVNIEKLNDFYLSGYDILPLFNDFFLIKKNPKSTFLTSDNLIIKNNAGMYSTLTHLSKDYPELYNRVLEFLDKVSVEGFAKLMVDSTETAYDNEYLSVSKENVQKIKHFKEKIIAQNINKSLDSVLSDISEADSLIKTNHGGNDKLRKIYFHYLPLLNEILANYVNLEKISPSAEPTIEASDKTIEICGLISECLDTAKKKIYEDNADNIDASADTVKDLIDTTEKLK